MGPRLLTILEVIRAGRCLPASRLSVWIRGVLQEALAIIPAGDWEDAFRQASRLLRARRFMCMSVARGDYQEADSMAAPTGVPWIVTLIAVGQAQAAAAVRQTSGGVGQL